MWKVTNWPPKFAIRKSEKPFGGYQNFLKTFSYTNHEETKEKIIGI